MLSVLLFWACADNKTRSDHDEELLFNLVAEPSSYGDYATALANADSLLYHVAMGDTLTAYIMMERCTAFFNTGNYRATLLSVDSLIDFSRKHKIEDIEIQALSTKGGVLRRENDYEGAILNIDNALNLANKSGNIEQEQNLADQLAVIYADLGRYNEALEFSRQSLKLAEALADTTAIISAASTYGAILTNSGKHRDAINFLQTYRTSAERGHPLYLIKYLTPLFSAYIKLDSLDMADKTLLLAEASEKPFGKEHMTYAVIRRARAQLAEARGDYLSQYAIYKELDSLKSHGQRAEISLLDHARCLHNLGRDREAFEMMHKAYNSLDSSKVNELRRQLSELSVKYGSLNKDLEIERLNRHRLLLWSVVIVSVLVLFVFTMLFLNLRRRAMRRHELEKQRQYINGLESERSRIAMELHDDIAGRLTALRLALPDASTASVAELLDSVSDSIRSLSHRMMSPEFENATLTQLLLAFTGKLQLSFPTIKFSISDEGSFNWDRIPADDCHEIYRMVQESVHNALKHAKASHIQIILDGDSENMIVGIINDGLADSEKKNVQQPHRTLKARANLIGAKLQFGSNNNLYRIIITKTYDS